MAELTRLTQYRVFEQFMCLAALELLQCRGVGLTSSAAYFKTAVKGASSGTLKLWAAQTMVHAIQKSESERALTSVQSRVCESWKGGDGKHTLCMVASDPMSASL